MYIATRGSAGLKINNFYIQSNIYFQLYNNRVPNNNPKYRLT